MKPARIVILAALAVGCAGEGLLPTVVVTSIDAPYTSEDGREARVGIVLTDEPTADVRFSVTSDKPTAGLPDVSIVVFTPANWDQQQTITVFGVDDPPGSNSSGGETDYNLEFGEAVSDDDRFAGLVPVSVALANLDNEVNYVIRDVANRSETIGWAIDETSSLKLGITLDDRPYEAVTFGFSLFLGSALASGDLSFAPGAAAGSGETFLELTFAPDDFDSEQVLEIFPIPDGGTPDPDKIFDLAIGASGDVAYRNQVAFEVSQGALPYQIVNIDRDSAVLVLTPRPLRVCKGKTLTATAQLSQAPVSGPVEVEFKSTDPRLVVRDGNVVFTATELSKAFTLEALAGVTHLSTYGLMMTVVETDTLYSELAGATYRVDIPDASDGANGAAGVQKACEVEQQVPF